MNELDAFLEEIVPQLTAADTALHNGDAAERASMWSHREPVTLFGAAVTTNGWTNIADTFDWLASRFSNCTQFECSVIAAGVSGDLAYIVAIEHTAAAIADEPSSYALRVTTILRREDSDWRVVHRHADPYDEGTTDAVARLRGS